MNQKTRQRAMRSFLASLFQSDLTFHEMRQLADELAFGNFSRELSEYIRDVLQVSDGMGHLKDPKGYSRESSLPEPSLATAMEIVSRRRLSKKVILELMRLASPWLDSEQLYSSETTKVLIEKYLRLASSAEAITFLGLLEGEPADAYMKGISRRDRSK